MQVRRYIWGIQQRTNEAHPGFKVSLAPFSNNPLSDKTSGKSQKLVVILSFNPYNTHSN